VTACYSTHSTSNCIKLWTNVKGLIIGLIHVYVLLALIGCSQNVVFDVVSFTMQKAASANNMQSSSSATYILHEQKRQRKHVGTVESLASQTATDSNAQRSECVKMHINTCNRCWSITRAHILPHRYTVTVWGYVMSSIT